MIFSVCPIIISKIERQNIPSFQHTPAGPHLRGRNLQLSPRKPAGWHALCHPAPDTGDAGLATAYSAPEATRDQQQSAGAEGRVAARRARATWWHSGYARSLRKERSKGNLEERRDPVAQTPGEGCSRPRDSQSAAGTA